MKLTELSLLITVLAVTPALGGNVSGKNMPAEVKLSLGQNEYQEKTISFEVPTRDNYLLTAEFTGPNDTSGRLELFQNRQLYTQSQWSKGKVEIALPVTSGGKWLLILSARGPAGNKTSWRNIKTVPAGTSLSPQCSMKQRWSEAKTLAEAVSLVQNTVKQAPSQPEKQSPSPTQAGEVTIFTPTLHSIGLYWKISGDTNDNGKVMISYRRHTDLDWLPAQPLLRQHGEISGMSLLMWRWVNPNGYTGEIFGLTPGTKYEIRLTLEDPDGGSTQKIVMATTKALPLMKYNHGRVLHVYPPTWQNARIKPEFSNLTEAYAEAVPGDTIYLHAGRHIFKPSERNLDVRYAGREAYITPPIAAEDIDLYQKFNRAEAEHAVHMNRQGRADAPIIIQGEPNGTTVVDGSGRGVLLDLSGATWHVLRNLTLENAEILIFARSAQNITVTGCELRRCRYGINAAPCDNDSNYRQRWPSPRLIRNFTITDNTITGGWAPGKWADGWNRYTKQYTYEQIRWSVGIQIGGQGHDISHNLVRRFWDGINVYPISRPEGGPESYNAMIDIYANRVSECGDDGIEMDYGVSCISVRDNLIDNCHMGISCQPLHGGPGYIFRNIIFNIKMFAFKFMRNPSGILAYHNTCIVSRSARICPEMENSALLNNLFLGSDDVETGPLWSGTATPEKFLLDYNGYRRNRIGKVFWLTPLPGRPFLAGQARLFDNLAAFSQNTGYEQHGTDDIDFHDLRRAPLPSLEHQDITANFDPRPTMNGKAAGRALHLNNISPVTKTTPALGALASDSPLPQYGPRKIVTEL